MTMLHSLRSFRLAVLILLGFSCTASHAAGFRFIEVPAGREGPPLRGAVWSPCRAPAHPIAFDPIVIQGVLDCPAVGTGLPLVVMSHGTGGSLLGHHDTAALADAGFVVAAINHPGDNFHDLSRQDRLSAFATRPVDMHRLVDYMLGPWPDSNVLNARRVGFFGFSRGGYTGLVAAGAVPDWSLRGDLCPPASRSALCQDARGAAPMPGATHDPRIRAAVIVDPLSVFDAAGLREVRIPVQLWSSAYGGDGVSPQSVQAVRAGLPLSPEWHLVKDAAHFVFLAPCSPALVRIAPPICADAPNFDRVRFHAVFNADVVAFLRKALALPSGS